MPVFDLMSRNSIKDNESRLQKAGLVLEPQQFQNFIFNKHEYKHKPPTVGKFALERILKSILF